MHNNISKFIKSSRLLVS